MRDICPASPGAKDWNPSSFSHHTGLLYIPHNILCMDLMHSEANYIAGTPYVGSEERFKPGPGGHRGEFTAWDIAAGKEVWTIKESFPVWSGARLTAAACRLGTMDGWFKAVEPRPATYGGSFRRFGISPAQPIGARRKQYVAILSA